MLRALDLLKNFSPFNHGSIVSTNSLPSIPSPSPPPTIPADRSPYFTPPKSVPPRLTQQKKGRSRSRDDNESRQSDGEGSVRRARYTRSSKERNEAPPTPQSPTPRLSKRAKRKQQQVSDEDGLQSPVSNPQVTSTESRPKSKAPRKKRASVPKDPNRASSRTLSSKLKDLTSDDAQNTILAKSEQGVIEEVGKILLIQERVRHDPWRMLIATCLLNVTSGRAARPIYVELLTRYPDVQSLAEASITDLSELLYPLGLFNQRAATLIRFSNQYLQLQWPIHPTTHPDPFVSPTQPKPVVSPMAPVKEEATAPQKHLESFEDLGDVEDLEKDISAETETEEMEEAKVWDVNVFHGAGRYASDSFRIYSDLLPGRGAPEREERWLEKRKRAIERLQADRQKGKKRREKERGKKRRKDDSGGIGVEVEMDELTVSEQGLDIEQVGQYLSDEEEFPEEEEWRKVRANDKELRRYLIWRWGLEGIVYDIYTGPHIFRERDKRRLCYLLPS